MEITIKAQKSGFTLLEILLVVGTIAILAGIVIQALNPAKQLSQTRNATRRSDVLTILNAINQYAIDNDGDLPGTISVDTCGAAASQEICRSGYVCGSKVSLANLVVNEKYIVSVPRDPTVSASDGAGYFVAQSINNRITVCAPSAELGETITVSR